MVGRFQAQIRNFTEQTERRQRAIFMTASQILFSRAQTDQPSVKETGGTFEVGKIPVDDGDLRNSFISNLNGGSTIEGPDSYVLTIARWTPGDTLFGGWTAEHAPHIEFGTENIEPRAFMRTHANNWQEIVDEAYRQVMGSS